jgi:endonuclease G
MRSQCYKSRVAVLLGSILLAVSLTAAGGTSQAPAGVAAQRVPLDVQAWGVPDGGQAGIPVAYGLAAYDGRLRFNRYTLELLTAKSLSGAPQRTASFKIDRRWPDEFRASVADYKSCASTYDRGHEAPSADQGDQDAQDAAFLLSNVSPQHKELNRGLWKQLEQQLRDMAQRTDVRAVWVATVPLFAPGDVVAEVSPRGSAASEPATIFFVGPNHVPVPTHFAKTALVLGDRDDNPVVLFAWLLPNRAPAAGETLEGSRCSVDLVEHWAGLDFWALLPPGVQERLEAQR